MFANQEATRVAHELIADIKTENGIQESNSYFSERSVPLPTCGWFRVGREPWDVTVDDSNRRTNNRDNDQNTSSVHVSRGLTADTRHCTAEGIRVGYRMDSNGVVKVSRNGVEPSTGKDVSYYYNLKSPEAGALVVKLAAARIVRNTSAKPDEGLFTDIDNGWFVPDVLAEEIQPEFEHAFRAIKEIFGFVKSPNNRWRLRPHTGQDKREVVLRADDYPGPGVIMPVGCTVLKLRSNGDWTLRYSEETSHSSGRRTRTLSFKNGVVTFTSTEKGYPGQHGEEIVSLSSDTEADLPQLANQLKAVGDRLDAFVYIEGLSYPERQKELKRDRGLYSRTYGII